MKFVKVWRQADTYWLVASDGIDSEGNWVPSVTWSFETTASLMDALGDFIAEDGQVVIRVPSELDRLLSEFTSNRLFSEWSIGA